MWKRKTSCMQYIFVPSVVLYHAYTFCLFGGQQKKQKQQRCELFYADKWNEVISIFTSSNKKTKYKRSKSRHYYLISFTFTHVVCANNIFVILYLFLGYTPFIESQTKCLFLFSRFRKTTMPNSSLFRNRRRWVLNLKTE